MDHIDFYKLEDGRIEVRDQLNDKEVSSFSWKDEKLPYALVTSALEVEHGRDLGRLEDPDREQMFKEIEGMLNVLKDRYNYVVKNFYIEPEKYVN